MHASHSTFLAIASTELNSRANQAGLACNRFLRFVEGHLGIAPGSPADNVMTVFMCLVLLGVVVLLIAAVLRVYFMIAAAIVGCYKRLGKGR